MRARMAAAFAIGFAVGALCVGAGLWWTGGLRTVAVSRAAPPAIQVPPPSLFELANKQPPPNVPTPPPTPPIGEADRIVPVVPEAPAGAPHISMPLAGTDIKTLASSFSDARGGHQHEALDIPAPRGTPVMAVAEGNVAKLFNSKQGGITVYQFDNTQNYCFYYAHLERYAKNLKEGMLLRKGDVLGYVGTTGDAPPDAPHLHLAVFKLGPEKKWWQGTAIDPLPLLQ